MDNKRYMKVINECKKLVISRNKSYGESVDYMRIQSIVDLCMMKLSRIRQLGETANKTKDELVDVLNYCVFAIEKYNKLKGGEGK